MDEFRSRMLKTHKIRMLHDFMDSKECFPSFSIEGGVCYFVWDKNHEGKCHVVQHNTDGSKSDDDRFLGQENIDIALRDKNDISILKKVQDKKHCRLF